MSGWRFSPLELRCVGGLLLIHAEYLQRPPPSPGCQRRRPTCGV